MAWACSNRAALAFLLYPSTEELRATSRMILINKRSISPNRNWYGHGTATSFWRPRTATDGWAVYDGNQIYGFPVAGGMPRQLTQVKGYALQIRPSPDGSHIAFAGYEWKGQSYT